MKFGLHLGTRGVASTPDGLREMARHAEAMGLSHLGLSDHVVIARSIDSEYPYNQTGRHPSTDDGFCLEQITALAFAAAVTERIELLTSVMVLPYRPPVLAAKMLATADVLSKGRLVLGAGIGWMAEEMAVLGGAGFENRVKASEEYLEAFRVLWTEDRPRYKGEHVAFDDIYFSPKPVRKPHPPIWIGGEGRPARRRAGRLGDGWYPVISSPRMPLDTAEKFAAGLADVRSHAEAAGRDPAILQTALFASWYQLGAAKRDADGRRLAFTGAAEEIAADVRAYGEAGLQTVLVVFETDDVNDAKDRVEALTREVVPLLG